MKKVLNGAVFLGGLAAAAVAWAGPADYVYTPKVERGELELDIKSGAAYAAAGQSVRQDSIGLGYGVSDNWFTEAYLKQERSTGGATITNAEWENRFLLNSGEWLDIGFVTEVEAPLSGGNTPWEVRMGPLFQSMLGKVQLNYNLLFERAFGAADESGVPYATNLGYQWQVRYHWLPDFQYGLQGFGEVGKWDHWDAAADQNHRMGPAVFGKFSLDGDESVKYNVAWLFGASTAAPGHTLRAQLEYEF